MFELIVSIVIAVFLFFGAIGKRTQPLRYIEQAGGSHALAFVAPGIIPRLSPPTTAPITHLNYSNQGLNDDTLLTRILAIPASARQNVVQVNLSNNNLTYVGLTSVQALLPSVTWLDVSHNRSLRSSETSFTPLLGFESLTFVNLVGTGFRLADWRYIREGTRVEANNVDEVMILLANYGARHDLFPGSDGSRLMSARTRIARAGALDQYETLNIMRWFYAATDAYYRRNGERLDMWTRPTLDELTSIANSMLWYAHRGFGEDLEVRMISEYLADLVEAHRALLMDLGQYDRMLELAVRYLERTTLEGHGASVSEAHARLGTILWNNDHDGAATAVYHWTRSTSHMSSYFGLARALAAGRGVARDDHAAASYLLHIFGVGQNPYINQAKMILEGETRDSYLAEAARLTIGMAEQERGGLQHYRHLVETLRHCLSQLN